MNILTSVMIADESGLYEKSLAGRLASELGRIRFQLLGGIVFAVVGPVILRGQFERFADSIVNYDNSLIGTSLALLFGFMFFRKMTALPGTSSTLSILPAFLLSYGAVAALFFALRLDFSRYQFVFSFGLAALWFFTILMVMQRVSKPKFGVIPLGRAKHMKEIDFVDWVELDSPEVADQHPELPLVADLRDDDIDDEWQRYLADAAVAGRRVFHAKQLRESLEGRVYVEHISENTQGHLAPDSLYAPLKRYLEFVLAIIALIILSPLLLIFAALIRIDSPGPALFKQTRMGYRGRPFTVMKFRSMRMQDDTKRNMTTDMTQSDDDRITKIGRFIRKTRIDELPQIWNILRGEMSWIGPRPETLNLSKWYEKEIPFYRYRHVVRPGITGWAQVNQGHVTSVDDVREKLEYDFYYVRHFSLWLDILIVIQTIRVMLTGHGAK